MSWRDPPVMQAMQQHGGSSTQRPPKPEGTDRKEPPRGNDGNKKPKPSTGWGGR